MSASDYKKALLTAMRALLAPRGFRKRGATFRRDVGDVVHVIQLQSSTKSTAEVLVATVNVGVFSRELERQLAGPIVEPTEPDCHWRERLGFLTPARRDTWWDVRSDKEAREAAAEIAELVGRYALPALDKLGSTERLRALWETGRSPGLTDFTRTQYLRALGQPAS